MNDPVYRYNSAPQLARQQQQRRRRRRRRLLNEKAKRQDFHDDGATRYRRRAAPYVILSMPLSFLWQLLLIEEFPLNMHLQRQKQHQ